MTDPSAFDLKPPTDENLVELLIRAKRGQSIMQNCNVMPGVRVNGAVIDVDPDMEPLCAPDREFTERIAVEWLRKAAPHQLALGGDDV